MTLPQQGSSSPALLLPSGVYYGAQVSASAVKRLNARVQKNVAEASKQAKAIKDRIDRINKSNESSRRY